MHQHPAASRLLSVAVPTCDDGQRVVVTAERRTYAEPGEAGLLSPYGAEAQTVWRPVLPVLGGCLAWIASPAAAITYSTFIVPDDFDLVLRVYP